MKQVALSVLVVAALLNAHTAISQVQQLPYDALVLPYERPGSGAAHAPPGSVVFVLNEYAQRSIRANDALLAGRSPEGTDYANLRRRVEIYADGELGPALQKARGLVCRDFETRDILSALVRVVRNARYFDSLEPAYLLADIASCNGAGLTRFLSTMDQEEAREVSRLTLFMLALPASTGRPARKVNAETIRELKRLAVSPQ